MKNETGLLYLYASSHDAIGDGITLHVAKSFFVITSSEEVVGNYT
jgi:hypothetical protein